MNRQVASLTLGELQKLLGGTLKGETDYRVDGVATLNDATPSQIALLGNSRYKGVAKKSHAGCLILAEKHAHVATGYCLVHPNPALAFAHVSQYFHPVRIAKASVHPSASIDASARVNPEAEIGAACVIGANVVIESAAIIGPGCIVQTGSVIGSRTYLVANVTLCENTVIGKECLIHPGAVIGADGFGFANDAGKWVKIPQTGKVLIGDNVEVGANTSVDRGSLRDTIIGEGVKLDNQIQIAHNVVIGAHTAIAALVGIAGSTTIGRYCTIGGEAGVIGHLTIGDHCHIAAQSLVTRSLPDGSHYSGGVPAVESGLWRRMIARLRHLDQLFDRVRALETKE